MQRVTQAALLVEWVSWRTHVCVCVATKLSKYCNAIKVNTFNYVCPSDSLTMLALLLRITNKDAEFLFAERQRKLNHQEHWSDKISVCVLVCDRAQQQLDTYKHAHKANVSK